MFSVIIPVWKRYVELRLILEKLNEQANNKNIVLEVVLCDSYSGDQMNDLIAQCKLQCNSLSIVHTQTKNILSAKRNIGISCSVGQYLIFLDDDCVPDDRFLTSVIEITNNYELNTVYCGEIRFEDTLVNKSNYYKYRDSKHPVYRISNGDKCIAFNAWTGVAMNFIISREIVNQQNIRFNEDYIGYGCEDHDFFHDLVKKNIVIKFSQQKIFHHEYGGDIKKFSTKIFCTARDGMKVLLKNAPDLCATNKKITLLERIFYGSDIISFILVKTVFNRAIGDGVSRFLIKFDGDDKFYFPTLYKYVLACAYINGIYARKCGNGIKNANDWYKS